MLSSMFACRDAAIVFRTLARSRADLVLQEELALVLWRFQEASRQWIFRFKRPAAMTVEAEVNPRRAEAILPK